jgi:hypothetical protein
MASYMSVNRTLIQTAFAKAHRLSQKENLDPAAVRREAANIAKLIWRACGEPAQVPATLPEEMQILAELGPQ